MFYIDYVGDASNPATAFVNAVNAMTSSMPTTFDRNLMVGAQALGLSAAFFAAPGVDVNAPGYSIHFQMRGGWDNGTWTLHMECQQVALTRTGNVRVGDPSTRIAPE